MIKPDELLTLAKEAMQNAYAPYSHFTVGAALLCKDGTVYTGCNIENGAFGAGICAERTALFKAVSDGKKDFLSIAVVGGNNGIIDDFCYPCGICRQALSEFCDVSFKFYFENGNGDVISINMDNLLPHSFNL